jgi:hypothetical protein
MKAEQDIVAMYKDQFNMALKLIKNLSDGKLRGDAYRNGLPKTEVL